MEDLLRLKKMSKIKLVFTSIGLIVPLILLVILELFSRDIESFEVLADLVVFRYAIFLMVEVFLIYKIYNYISVLHSDDFANKLLIKKNDERNNYIRMKTNSKVIEIVLYLLCIALISTAFYKREVFYTLLSVFIGIILTFVITHIWYTKKY